MNKPDPIQEQRSTPQPITKDPVLAGKPPHIQKEASTEEYPGEETIDLNLLFPDTEIDLNNLFPDDELKGLLKKIIKNKKDMSLIKERLANENEIPKAGNERELTKVTDGSDKDKATK